MTIETYLGDNLQLLKALPDKSVDLVFTDPQYNIGHKYPSSNADSLTPAEYVRALSARFLECWRCLTPTGAFVVVIGQRHQADVFNLLERYGNWRNSIVWHYTFGQHQRRKFTPSWAMLHYFTVGDDFAFNVDAVRVPSDRQLKYNDKRANPLGKTPTDVWDVSRLCGTFKARVEHSCQLPPELCERVILALSNPGDTVLDPYLGTGETLVAAKKLGRNGIGMEIAEETLNLAKSRLK